MKKLLLFLILTLLLLVAFLGYATEYLPISTPAASAPLPETAAPTEITAPTVSPTTTPTAQPLDSVTSLIQSMTLREKVGQLFIVRPDALDLSLSPETVADSKADGVTALTADMAATLQDYPVGGIVMFGKNLTSPDQITQFNAALQAATFIPLFLSVDEEGGSVARLANHSAFDLPQYKNAASISDPEEALDMGLTIGGYLSEYGFNMDFAPVADVNTNPDNPIIGTRAFSSDPQTARELVASMADGLRQQGVIPVYKHFPGHGDTAEDSHVGLAVTHKTLDEMARCEWIPFQTATASDCIMVGHIAAPEITGDQTPASLSYQMVTEILKGQLGFEGLVITDSLSMDAITVSSGEAALAALQAGCDLLLMPADLQDAFDTIVDAVNSGIYSETALNETVTRILRFKESHGLLSFG